MAPMPVTRQNVTGLSSLCLQAGSGWQISQTPPSLGLKGQMPSSVINGWESIFVLWVGCEGVLNLVNSPADLNC